MRLRNIPGSREIIAASPFVIQEPETYRGRWQEAFSSPGPLHVEIGMGKGRFLMDLAEKNPGIRYLGIEMYSSVLVRGVQKAARRFPEDAEAAAAAANFRFLRFDATDLEQIFGPGEIGRIYLNFSDPWPKDRHADRRLTSGRFLARYEKILQPGGDLLFKTDNTDLFDFSLESLAACGWTVTKKSRDLHADAELMRDNVLTEYEERFQEQGKPICFLRALPGDT